MNKLDKHSVSRWCFSGTDIDSLCKKLASIGVQGLDLPSLGEAKVVRDHGLAIPVTAPEPDSDRIGAIPHGFNDPKHWGALHKLYEDYLPKAAALGVPQVIVFSGNRSAEISDEQGRENCAEGIAPLLPIAAELGITLTMELLNSKVDHHGYQCDHTSWGVRLCKLLNHPSFGLLYDIYHMQIMEGDVIQTIRDQHQHISHYHTAGVPGRNEFGANQELNYPAIFQTIADTGYDGFLGHEYLPTTGDPFEFLPEVLKMTV